jgi:uncharacterized protein YjcR
MKLTAQHYEAMNYLIQGVNGRDTAAKLGVTEETVSRWKHDYDFQAAMNARLHENQQMIEEKLRYLSTMALQIVENIMSSPESSNKDRLSAACKVLDLARVQPGKIKSTNPLILKLDHEL